MSKSPRQEADSSTTASDKEFLECPDCKKSYESRYGVRYHLRNTQCVGYECDYCERSLPTEGGMKRHQATSHDKSIAEHDNNKKHHCETCGKEYNSRGGLKYHYKNTACKPPVKCSNCGDVFINEHGLKTHISQYCEGVGKAKFTCDYCGEISYKRTGRIYEHNFCNRECWRSWHNGENASNWKGGGSGYYGPNWIEQRKKARKRDDYTCQACGATKQELGQNPDVHHIQPLRWFKENYDEPDWYEKGNDLENLICLCCKNGCHQKWEGIPLKPITPTS